MEIMNESAFFRFISVIGDAIPHSSAAPIATFSF
jgi:hypothetical protein